MAENSVRKLGFWSALIAFIAAIGYSAAQIFSTTSLLLGLPWIVTAPGSMLLLALFFRGDMP